MSIIGRAAQPRRAPTRPQRRRQRKAGPFPTDFFAVSEPRKETRLGSAAAAAAATERETTTRCTPFWQAPQARQTSRHAPAVALVVPTGLTTMCIVTTLSGFSSPISLR